MVVRKTLSTLTYDDLSRFTAWGAVGDYTQDADPELQPVELDSKGRIPTNVGEVWCLCTAVFADGTEHAATAMCRGDTSGGPLLWSFWNGSEDVVLLLPPAPPPVLAKSGPESFAVKFGMKTGDIFPITLKCVPRFSQKPELRQISLGVSGVL